jgi:hypothetical protein
MMMPGGGMMQQGGGMGMGMGGGGGGNMMMQPGMPSVWSGDCCIPGHFQDPCVNFVLSNSYRCSTTIAHHIGDLLNAVSEDKICNRL